MIDGTSFETLSRMGRTALAEKTTTIEQGSMRFLYRPRVEEQHPAELGDVQRLLIVLSPHGGVYERAIAIGRKHVPSSSERERFWGFVDLVLTADDMEAALGAQVYGTKTRGLRHLPAARPFACGSYQIDRHDGHAHLRWHVAQVDRNDPVARDIDLEGEADYIVTIANPDPTVWGLLEPPDLQTELFDDLELHVTVPTPFSQSLQQRFRGRRFAQLDSTTWLDHPGAELVFVGTSQQRGALAG